MGARSGQRACNRRPGAGRLLTDPIAHARELAAWFEDARATLPDDLWVLPHVQVGARYYEKLALRLERAREERRISPKLVAELERLKAAAEQGVEPGMVDAYNDMSRPETRSGGHPEG